MTDKKKEKRGKKPRYDDEKSERLSILLRPRYKNALKMLAKERNSTLSEASEFVISHFCREHIVDGKPLIDYVRPKNEPFMRYYSAVAWGSELSEIPPDFLQDSIWDFADELGKIPASLRSAFDKYQLKIFQRIAFVEDENVNFYLSSFDPGRLNYAISEDWKEGRSVREAVHSYWLAAKTMLAERVCHQGKPFHFVPEISQADFDLINGYLEDTPEGFADAFHIIKTP